jgi:UDP-N-acetylglucosamine--N-acetylmuramyl-(pentapeptide) pyrophosphoryl-undecaprenol N-acetylglucosamine transferase
MSQKKPRLLIAAGGTGGHLFPAQALAQELFSKDPHLELLFAGAGLSANRYFNREIFHYLDVSSGTPFRGNILTTIPRIFKGIRKSLKLLEEYHPTLLIGFGSFHSFPLIVAALIKRTPFLLFESNAMPGKVNRLFSRWAEFTALHFMHAGKKLSGKTIEVSMPMGKRKEDFLIDQKAARIYFGLDPDRFTFLVFGGSQGAFSINKIFCEAAGFLGKIIPNFQVIHLTGHQKDAEKVRNAYALLGISACVKEFEEQMPKAWRAADLAICRCGAATVSELIASEVPSILIPYPFASDDHQRKNGEILEKEIQGARVVLESELTAEHLVHIIRELSLQGNLEEMRKKLGQFHRESQKSSFSDLVYSILREGI